MPASPLTVLHVVAPAPFGGLESVVRLLASGHHRRGHRIHVVAVLSADATVRPEDHPFVRALAATDVPVTPLAIGDREYGRERAAIQALCREHRPDVVHTHGFRPDVIDAGIARRAGARVVSTVHGFIGGTVRGRVYEWVQRRALRRFDAVIAVSRAIEQRLLDAGVADGRLHLVPNAFAPTAAGASRAEARARLALDGVEPVVGWVGRLSREKGPDVALRAFAEARLPEGTLVIVGAGPEEPALRALAVTLGIADRVRWSGPVPAAGELFAAFDAFFLSSRTEGTPVVLLEAMAARVPIVATRVGGVPDVVSEREAWLLPSEDVPALAAALRDWFASADRGAMHAQAARDRLDRQFAPEPWLDRHEAIYRGAHTPTVERQ